MVVTNNYFTPNAIELAKANNVELWDRKTLIEKAILSVNPDFNISFTQNTQDYKNNALYNISVADELLPEAINLVIEEEQASISLLQRKLSIEYTRAARLIDEMEERGIVGGYEGSKPRKVLINKDELLTNSNKNYKNLELQTNSKTKLSLKHKTFRLFISLLIMVTTWFIAALTIENALAGSLTFIALIFVSFLLGNWITQKLFIK
ncbi:restriction endonuclease [Anaerosalibacter bizertensis]|nr:restriction endonuclease [Anaerosalibacter bizertensis]